MLDKLNDLLKESEITLPIASKSINFYDEFENALQKFTQKVLKYSILSDDDIISINELIGNLLLAVKLNMEGSPEDYKYFSKALTVVEHHLRMVSDILGKQEKDLLLFRMRTIENPYSVNRGQMFHIPFELRRRVQPQRYSIQGLPCLYMGSSLLACYEEMRRPQVHQIHASLLKRYYEDEIELKTLHIGYTPSSLVIRNKKALASGKYTQKALEELTYAYIICWPLIAACSFIVHDRRLPYKPEYIIPQLLLKWVKEENNDYYGICYFSVHEHLEYTQDNYMLHKNYVYPAFKFNNSGFCDLLTKHFPITNSFPMQEFLNNNSGLLTSIELKNFVYGDPFLDSKTSIDQYYFSNIGKFEEYLRKQESSLENI